MSATKKKKTGTKATGRHEWRDVTAADADWIDAFEGAIETIHECGEDGDRIEFRVQVRERSPVDVLIGKIERMSPEEQDTLRGMLGLA
jgi:hypothetical protein